MKRSYLAFSLQERAAPRLQPGRLRSSASGKGRRPKPRARRSRTRPSLTPFFANSTNSTGAAVVVCPGGGYGGLAPREGKEYARWLNELGIHAFVLKYRLGSSGYRHPAMMLDVRRAVRIVRRQRVGVGACVHGMHALRRRPGGRLGARGPRLVQAGLRNSLLPGDHDGRIYVRNSLDFGAALREYGAPFAMHVYPRGAYGMGLGSSTWDPARRHPWTAACEQWLKEQKLAAAKKRACREPAPCVPRRRDQVFPFRRS